MEEQINLKEINPLRYWCQKVLPLVYDDSLSYYELLNKVVHKLNELINNNNHLPDYIKQTILELITPENIRQIIESIFEDLKHNIIEADDHDSTTTTSDRKAGELLWLNDNIYCVVRDMDIGDAYIDYGENPNIRRTTIEKQIKQVYYEQDEAIETTAIINANESILSHGDYHLFDSASNTIRIIKVD